MKTLPPLSLIAAIKTMLEPYGIDSHKLFQDDKINNGIETKWLTPRSIEVKYGLGRWSIYRLIRNGSLKSAKLSAAKSGKVLVDAESLQKYLASKQFIPKKNSHIKTDEGN